MEHLFSPWRSHYIQSLSQTDSQTSSQAASTGCFLCDAYKSGADDNDNNDDNDDNRSAQNKHSAAERDAENLVVARREHCFVILNRYPYNAGHLMVVPNRHVGALALLDDATLANIMHTLRESEQVLTRVLKPHAMNVGANLGREAGAGVPDHVHFHVVPRWNGDTNFMPVLADVRVVSEAIADTQARLAAAFSQSAGT
jgi:ATP adenylyltransferase